MRPVQLARIAARAEKLRLQRLARRQAVRAGCAVAGIIFVVALLAMLHVAATIALARRFGPVTSCLTVGGVDLLIALLLLLRAAISSPSTVEIEAKQVRDDALVQMRQATALTALITPIGRALMTRMLGGRASSAPSRGGWASKLFRRR